MVSPCVFRKRTSDKYLAFIKITNSCNMKCKHCMNWSVKNAKIFIKHLTSKNKCSKIYTNNINKAVKRNIDRFPEEFCFQLTENEFQTLRFQIGTSKQNLEIKDEFRGERRYLPFLICSFFFI